MPINRELLWLYPTDWPEISRRVRFERAGGVCEDCGRPHAETVRCLPDGRWFDATQRTWRNHRGRPARWPDIEEAVWMRQTRVILAAAHLDHNPANNRLRNLRSLCQRCHMIHDRPHHLARRRITYLLRRALGDLFFGAYSASAVLEGFGKPQQSSKEGHHALDSEVFVRRRPHAHRFTDPYRAAGLDRTAQQGLELGVP